MRAHEILEADNTQAVSKLVEIPSGTWYKVSKNKMNSLHKKWFGRPMDPVTTYGPKKNLGQNTQILQDVVFVDKGKTIENFSRFWATLDGNEIVSFYNGIYEHELEAFKALVDAIGAQNGKKLYGDYVLYNGTIYDKKTLFTIFPVVATVAGNPVYELPKDAWWILNQFTGLRHAAKCDRVLVTRTPKSEFSKAFTAISIFDNKIVMITSVYKPSSEKIQQLSSEIAKAFNLGQKQTVEHFLIPKTKTHKILQIIDSNPGIERLPLYLAKMQLMYAPTYEGKEDIAHELSQLGLVEEKEGKNGSTNYTITTPGTMVLAALNNGTSIRKSDLRDMMS